MTAVLTSPHAPLDQMSDADLQTWIGHCWNETVRANDEFIRLAPGDPRARREYAHWGAELRAAEAERVKRGRR